MGRWRDIHNGTGAVSIYLKSNNNTTVSRGRGSYRRQYACYCRPNGQFYSIKLSALRPLDTNNWICPYFETAQLITSCILNECCCLAAVKRTAFRPVVNAIAIAFSRTMYSAHKIRGVGEIYIEICIILCHSDLYYSDLLGKNLLSWIAEDSYTPPLLQICRMTLGRPLK